MTAAWCHEYIHQKQGQQLARLQLSSDCSVDFFVSFIILSLYGVAVSDEAPPTISISWHVVIQPLHSHVRCYTIFPSRLGNYIIHKNSTTRNNTYVPCSSFWPALSIHIGIFIFTTSSFNFQSHTHHMLHTSTIPCSKAASTASPVQWWPLHPAGRRQCDTPPPSASSADNDPPTACTHCSGG